MKQTLVGIGAKVRQIKGGPEMIVVDVKQDTKKEVVCACRWYDEIYEFREIDIKLKYLTVLIGAAMF